MLRLRAGDRVSLFDGNGTNALAEIVTTLKRNAQLRIVEKHHCEEARPRLVLATAVPKGDRFRWLVEKATELGVARLVPLETELSSVDPRERKLDKLRQTVIAACKQCGRSRLMEIDRVTHWNDFVAAEMPGHRAVVAHPVSDARLDLEQLQRDWRGATVVAAIGPEGGFTPEEVELAIQAGARPICLGPQLLRIETAAIAVATLCALLRE